MKKLKNRKINSRQYTVRSYQFIKVLITAYCLLIHSQLITAQVFPVQVTPQLIPPYSSKLSDYGTTSSEKLFVNLLLTDTQDSGRQVRLKLYIEGQGLNVQSLDFVAGAAPIVLDGGINLRLSNLDLRPYFNLNNLLGITPQQYNQPLPDGRYEFCFEVYDQFSGRLLSQKRCASIFLILNDPPFLNLPNRGDLVTARAPQNILFNWTPRHLNATGVQYEFTLKELWDTGMDPQAAFLASPVLHQETSFAPTLLYGPAHTPLLEGKTYGWQVRALVSDGISETSVFRNNGYSEIYHFRYVGNCDPPQFILSEAQNAQMVEIAWQASEHLRYRVEYRKKGYGEADWFGQVAYNNALGLKNLEPGATYEFRVGGECTFNGGFAFSSIYEFAMPTEDETAYYNCGVAPGIAITNQGPLPAMQAGDTFTAGDFPVVVVEASGSNGTFSGQGYITLPFLESLKDAIDALNVVTDGKVNIGKFTRIKVEFEGVGINTDYQLTSGMVKTSYDPNWNGVLDVNEAIDELLGNDGDVNEFDAANVDVVDVQVDEDGNVTLIDSDGNQIPIETGLPVVITDKNDEQWLVDEDGNVTPLGQAAEGGPVTAGNTNGIAGNGSVSELTSKDVTIDFVPSENGYYATDQLRQGVEDPAFRAKYESIPQAHGAPYELLYKALSDAPNTTDQVLATATFANGKTPADIIFKTKEGTQIDASWQGNTATLSLKKLFNFAKQDVLAVEKPKDSTGKYDIAGVFNLWHLQQQGVKVTVVPVGSALNYSQDDLQRELNTIYQPVGVNFTVTLADPLNIPEDQWDRNNTGRFDVGDSDALANYTVEQRALWQYFKEQRAIEDQMYYMFVLDGSITPSKPEIDGFMPLKRQYGFVFDRNGLVRTLGHELGHGVFGLKHPFSEYDLPKRATDLLMDYCDKDCDTKTAFTQMDWQQMHAPGLQLYWFQGDEEGESTIINGIPERFHNSNGTITFMTMDGNYITLPKAVRKLWFIDGLDNLDGFTMYPTGALYKFQLGDKTYRADVEYIPFDNYDAEIEDLTFTYNGFVEEGTKAPFPMQEEHKNYFGKVVLNLFTGDNKKLIANEVNQLKLESKKSVNIFLDGARFNKFYAAYPPLEKLDYAYNDNTIQASFQLTQDYIDDILGKGLNWGSNYLVMSKIASLYNAYPIYLKNYLNSELKISTDDGIYYAIFSSSSFDILRYTPIYIGAINFIKDQSKNCFSYLSEINENSSYISVKNCISALSDNEIENMAIDDKLMAISILLNQIGVYEDSEVAIIKLLKFTKGNDVDDLLTGLQGKSKTETSKYLIKEITYHIDNDHTWLSEDNYKNLIITLAEITVGKSKIFKNKLENLNFDDLIERNIKFYYKSFWEMVLGDFSAFWNLLNGQSIYTYDTKVDWDSDNGTNVNIKTNIYIGNELIDSTKPIKLEAFEPIYFTNKSGLSMLSDYNKDKPVLSPAILAYYASDVGNTKTIVDGIQASVDAISIATGYGTLARAPSLVRKTFIIADMIGSGVSITKSATGENLNPEAKAFLDALDILTASIAITELGSNAKNLKHIFRRVKSNGTGLPQKDDVKNFLDKLIKCEGKIDQSFDQNKLQEAKVWISNLEMEAKLGNIDDLKDDIEKAKRILANVSNVISSYPKIVSRGFNVTELTTELKKWNDDESIMKTAMDLFEEENYSGLYKHFKDHNLNPWNNINWPFAKGFSKIVEKVKGSNYTKKIDRFQKDSYLSGSFGSPINNSLEGVDDLVYTYDSRMLASDLESKTYYFSFNLTDKAADLELTIGDVAPWFGRNEKLAGEQIEFSKKLQLLDDSYVKNVQAQQFILGKWRRCVIKPNGKEVVTELQDVFNRLPKDLSDDLVDYINMSESIFQKFMDAKNANKLDQLIEAYQILRKNGIKTPCL